MKKIFYVGILLISMIGFTSGVNAANYSEGNWVQTSDNCGEYSEVANGYTGYTFDANTGVFNLTGSSYSESMSGAGERVYVFYTVSSDQKTLNAYIPSYNNNLSFIDSSLGIPAGNCSTVYKVSKSSISNIVSDTDDTTGGNVTEDSTENNNDNTIDDEIVNNDDNTSYIEPGDAPTNFVPGNGDGENNDNYNTEGTV